jgi:NAD(P)-dependent dehydrogenase (short-subunit alcohol dehydrogenase family)
VDTDTTSRVAIVTAAGRGMGEAIARALAGEGYRLALMSSGGGAEALASELGALGVSGSVTDPSDLATLIERAMDRYGRVDALVNNTGHPAKGDLLTVSDEDWHAGLDLLLLNVVRSVRLVTPIMKQRGGGAIVNISTFGAVEPALAFPVSSTIRAGLSAFTKLYADRYAPSGIRMNNVLPGFIDSYPETAENLAAIPADRYGRVEEVAATVAFLLSDAAGYITGQNIRVDGGITRSL